jgi:hypothetical protein
MAVRTGLPLSPVCPTPPCACDPEALTNYTEKIEEYRTFQGTAGNVTTAESFNTSPFRKPKEMNLYPE